MSREFASATTDNVNWAAWGALPTAVTISAWIKVSTWGSTFARVVVVGDDTTNTTCNIQAALNRMRLQRGGTSDTLDNTLVPDGTWRHVLWASDGTDEQFWVDGVQQSNSLTGATSDTTSGYLRIGNGQAANDRPLGGQMAYVSVYGRVLSGADIATLQTDAWLGGDPDLLFASNADVDTDSVAAGAGTVTGTTLHAADNPAVTEPGGGAGIALDGTSAGAATASGTLTVTSGFVAPTNLAATAVSATAIDLTWTDNATAEDGYLVERSLDEAAWVEIAEVAANSVSHSDTGLTASTSYFYRVRGFRNS